MDIIRGIPGSELLLSFRHEYICWIEISQYEYQEKVFHLLCSAYSKFHSPLDDLKTTDLSLEWQIIHITGS